ncbi:hypothetical protein [Streptomyces sp. CB01881]|uniref:hypothetical protein n=1 Tax=Streptomyces sp. CB01881 TaxID=2078691 RepID=UPI001F11F1F9|nr:hypothetical protein [Streptomyces sp. CB01881]
MDLGPELSPPPVSPSRQAELSREIGRIADLVATASAGAEAAVTAFNLTTGHDYRPLDFTGYEGSRSREEFAREAARPARPRVPDITRDELVEIVRRILAASPETDHYLRVLTANVVHPRVGDLVFHPPAGLRGASAEQIVDEALRYRPIAL